MHRLFRSSFVSLLILTVPLSATAYSFADVLARQAIRSALHAPQARRTSATEISQRGASVTHGSENKACADLHPYGLPRANEQALTARSYYTCRLGYGGQYDPVTKTPRWIAEKLDRSSLEGEANRKGMDFEEDQQIPAAHRSTLNDYRRSGLNRGHLAAAADFRGSTEMMRQSFLLTNVVPEDPKHNREVWANLEAAVRELATRRGQLFVLTGPVNGTSRRTIGHGVVVPEAMFKVLIDPKTQEMTGFIIPNRDDQGDDPGRFQVSVRDVEHATGLDFNSRLSRKDADRLEVAGGSWIVPRIRLRFRD